MEKQEIEEIKNEIKEIQQVEGSLQRTISLVKVAYIIILINTVIVGAILLGTLSLENAVMFFINVFCLMYWSIDLGRNSQRKQLLSNAQRLEKQGKELIELTHII